MPTLTRQSLRINLGALVHSWLMLLALLALAVTFAWHGPGRLAFGQSAGTAPSAQSRPENSATTAAPAKPLLDLPPISLSVTKISLRQLVEALNTSLGIPDAFSLANPTVMANDTPRFSVDARQIPFWEVFQMIVNQGLLEVQGIPGGGLPLLTSMPEACIRRFQVNGPVALCPTNISLSMAGGAGATAQQQKPPLITAHLLAMIDPRVTTASPNGIQLLKAVDDQDQELKITQSGLKGAARSNICTTTLTWSPGNKPATEVTLTCEVHFTVQLSQATATVEDPHVGAIIQLAGHQFLLSRLTMSSSNFVIQMEGADDASKNVPIIYSLLDAKGRVLMDSTKESMLNPAIVRLSAPAPATPLKLIVKAPDRTTEIVKPFVVKMPLP